MFYSIFSEFKYNKFFTFNTGDMMICQQNLVSQDTLAVQRRLSISKAKFDLNVIILFK